MWIQRRPRRDDRSLDRIPLLVGAIAVLVGLGCTPLRGQWDVAALESRVPDLARIEGSRLGDLPPHFVPIGDELRLFLCRWPTPGIVRVALPRDATEREQGLIDRALAAWASAGLGVAFETHPRAPGGIEIAFAEEGRDPSMPRGIGDTLADCQLGAVHPSGGRQARLRFASILLRRSNMDMLGRPVPFTDDEFTGAVMHELGHALGFSGHVAAGGGSVMSASTETVRKVGARVNAGEPFADPTLRALYSVPSGVLVGRVPLVPEAAAQYARLAGLAAANDLAGPYTRAGDRAARIFWRDARGVPVALSVRGWPAALARPREIVFDPNPAARLLEARASRPQAVSD